VSGALLLAAEPPSAWMPQAPPSLTHALIVALDLETTGLRWWAGDRPIGIGIGIPDGPTQYLPWGHQGGGNLDEQVIKRWARRELRGKHVVNLNTRFDVHMLRAWGIDLEAQGCTVSDVAHSAALLDDHRQRFSLDALAQDYLGEVKTGQDLDPTRMALYPAGRVAHRAEGDVRQVLALRAVFAPRLRAENLERVQRLEDQIIFVVCEMERNGCPIDTALLDHWITESEQTYLRGLWRIWRATGLKITPTAPTDLERLFEHLHLPLAHTPDGRPSFTDAVLALHDHPVITTLRHTRKIASLRSKYLLKYKQSVGSDGVMRYALHQCRAQSGGGTAGTVTGRFSSTALDRGVGINIQQVIKHADTDYPIRRLHRPASGLWLSADAAQIEYRLFAAEAKNPRVLREYAADPTISFHHLVWTHLQRLQPDITYSATKSLNFCKLYGGGGIKIAQMLSHLTADDATALRAENARWNHPKLAATRAVLALYARVLPEVGPLLTRTAILAERQGYVTTILGRRARLTDHYYKALNRMIQGSAADVMKLKLIALHEARAETGFVLRATIHDEVVGDIPDLDAAQRVGAILDQPSVDLPVPILWAVATGATWAACD
jgi:DNA polymerase I-like protein with 3'-5' exonuclease and polymerase domains